VTSKLVVGAVGFGVVAVGRLDERAGLVGHDQSGHAADELQGLHLRADPVGGGLPRRGAGVGVVRSAQGGHEDLGLSDLTGDRVDDGHGVAGVVDKQLLAGAVFLPQDDFLPLEPAAVKVAEARIPVSVRVLLAILLPEQLQGDELVGLQFPTQGGIVGLGRMVARLGYFAGGSQSLAKTVIVPIGDL
jgi:hypothetical protein